MSTTKLTDTQLVILSAASQREDRGIVLPPNLKGGAAQKLIAKLIDLGFVEEIRARGELPVWRRDDNNRPMTLRITKRGLNVIAVEEADDSPKSENADQDTALCRSQPPRLSRDLLIRTIAYRMQERAYGGPSKATVRKLQSLAKDLETNGSLACDVDHSVRPGMRLVREWRGRLHTVIVTQEGFEFAGKRYASLSMIAHAITGAHWSGPRFFGLNRNRTPAADPSDMVGGEGSSHD